MGENARTYGQDLMRGEHKVGARRGPAGLTYGAIENANGPGGPPPQTGTSIFDPVLCELAYSWFCPPGGVVLDPFSGGSVRGIVASRLGRAYHGIDLSARQLEANRQQAAEICGPEHPAPTWYHGDAAEMDDLLPAELAADFIFSCPPYYDLEIYSDDPRDLSAMGWDAFREGYADIIHRAARRLKDDRFACFVVGDVRDRKGFYRHLPGTTVEMFAAAGLQLYNDAILVTVVGSLPLRVGQQFRSARKLGKTHQNVLVFCKGDPRKAAEAIGMPQAVQLRAATAEEEDGEAVPVRISAKSARLRFIQCGPECIEKKGCTAKCCDAPSHPWGCRVVAQPEEEPALVARGAVIEDGYIRPREGERRCPFKTDEHLCGLHFTPAKPFGCIASPFTLNDNGTLVVRNRYKLLPCYDPEEGQPAYKAFSASLDLLFGADRAAKIAARLDTGEGDLEVPMPRRSYDMLRGNAAIRAGTRPEPESTTSPA